MTDRMILTPYFLDEFDPAAAALAGHDWRVVAPALPDGDRPARPEPHPRPPAPRASRAVAARALGPTTAAGGRALLSQTGGAA